MSTPIWLQDEPWLQTWLGWFLDRLDKSKNTPRDKAITRRVKKSTLPALYQFDEDTEGRWQLLERLAKEHHIFEIQYDQILAPFQERYENAQFRLNPESEALLRQWLHRPLNDPNTLVWHQAVHTHAEHFIDYGEALLNQKPLATGYSPGDIVEGFSAIAPYLDQQLTLREISARCFNGDSKFLDNRYELLQKLFGPKAENIQPRPLLLTAWAPQEFTHLLIVENQDSFLRLVEQPPVNYALLYSGGFRASANRLVSHYTQFAFLPGSHAENFMKHWQRVDLPVAFWGDLDYAGMGILKALKQSLPQLSAWEPGYQLMLNMLQQGEGHYPEQAGKSSQIDPQNTGCDYSDKVLLPAIRQFGMFIDQEAVRLIFHEQISQDK